MKLSYVVAALLGLSVSGADVSISIAAPSQEDVAEGADPAFNKVRWIETTWSPKNNGISYGGGGSVGPSKLIVDSHSTRLLQLPASSPGVWLIDIALDKSQR